MSETNVPEYPRYINRELSLLEFQRRVLSEAGDEGNPLLERIRFLSIFGANMDEFFMVRVSGIRKQVETGVLETAPDGLTPRGQLKAIRKLALHLFKESQRCYRTLLPELDKAGIHVLEYKKLNQLQRKRAEGYFRDIVFPVLTPLALDPGHPFPHISNQSINLAIVIRDPAGKEKFARLKVPDTLPRLVPLRGAVQRRNGSPGKRLYFVWLEQIIIANLAMLFPGMTVVEAHPFRIIRDADIEIQELEADDLLESMQQSVRKRKFGSVVQVSIYDTMPRPIRDLLLENLEVNVPDVYVLRALLGFSSLEQICADVDRPDLKYPPHRPAVHSPLNRVETPEDYFDLIREENILLHHPYDSFMPVVGFLSAAARDPNVLAIKQTLYRTGLNSPVVEALLEAAERGKQVAVLVELKARFDEESNIGWALKLEEAGVHVVYGVVGLKTHCKIGMVVRKEGEGIRRYIHLSTGNYNAVTSRIYEDVGIFTCDEAMGADATDLFNFLTGYSTIQEYRKLWVAPVNLRQHLEKRIRREMVHAVKGTPSHIILKVNSLVDASLIELFYEASCVGVKIDLLVRGICSLVPGVPKVSENIRVLSVIGRFLEHSRIFYFANAGHPEVFLGSADLMPRNLNYRVEVLFPLERKEHIKYVRTVLEQYLKDAGSAWKMLPDGTYARLSREGLNIQHWLMKHSHER